MQLVDAGTPHGRVHLFVREGNPGPVVVAINGLAAPRTHWWIVPDGYDCACIDLPGCGPPSTDEISPSAFAEAFDYALARTFPGREFVKVGISTGGVVAMLMRTRGPILASEPFLHTGPLWPMHEAIARDRWMWSPEGQFVAAALFDNRDYSAALRGLRDRVHILAGNIPLEPRRPLYGMPSLTSAADRAAFEAHPLVTMEIVAGGHELPHAAIRAALERLLADEIDQQPAVAAGIDEVAPSVTARSGT